MTPSVSSSARQAALMVHTMCATDREWLLKSLPGSQRAELEALLSELRELGIPAQPQLLQTLNSSPITAAALAASGDADTDRDGDGNSQDCSIDNIARVIDALDGAQILTLSQHLKDEPPMLIAHMLRLRRWSWQATLLGQLGAPQRRHVQEALHDLSLRQYAGSTLLQAEILRGIYQRLVQSHPTMGKAHLETPVEAPRSSIPRWMRQLRKAASGVRSRRANLHG